MVTSNLWLYVPLQGATRH